MLTESQFNASINKRSSANSIINLTNPQNQGKGVLCQRQKSARNLPSTTNLNKEQLSHQYKPQTFLKVQDKPDPNGNNYKKRECEIISEIEFISEKVHKFEFYLEDMLEKIRRHSMYAECSRARKIME